MTSTRTAPSGRSGWSTSAGIRLHHLEYGDRGPVIVILPGITSPAVTWEFVARELACDARVVVLDIRGRGLSERPSGRAYSLSDYAGDVAAVIESIGATHPIVLGHSMGGRIAAALGAMHPGVAGSLIIADPPLTGPGRPPYPTSLESFQQQLQEGIDGTDAQALRRFYPRWPERELKLRAEWLDTCDPAAVTATWENFHAEDVLALWQALPSPLLLIYGEESPVVGPDEVAEVRALNPAAEIVGIPDAGHMIPWENLPDFLAAVRAFTASVAAGE